MKMPRRQRTAYNRQQIMQLEMEFKVNHYLDRQRRVDLAKRIGLVERQVEVWFQNRRMKEKKLKRDPGSHHDSDGAPSPASSSRSEPSPGPPSISSRPVYNEQQLMVNALATAMYGVAKQSQVLPTQLPAQQQLTQQLQQIYKGAGFYNEIDSLSQGAENLADDRNKKQEERRDNQQSSDGRSSWGPGFL